MKGVPVVIHYIKKSKYVLTLSFFAVWITFFDQYSYVQWGFLKSDIREVTQEIATYKKEYTASTLQLEALESNVEALERVAREKYFMKKKNEDVFVFEEDVKE